MEWETFNRIVFELPNKQTGETEPFYKTRKKTSFWDSISLGGVFIGSLSTEAFQHRDGHVGTIGMSKHSKRIRVKCPYCEEIQKLRSELQKCTHCKKKFYLHDK
jgi:hypothetical protein